MDNKIWYPLNSIYLYLTDRCNLRCRHCWIVPDYSDGLESPNTEVDIKYIKKAVIDAKGIGLGYVKLTGGEPFLRKDILDIIQYLWEQGITVDIETNGTRLNKEIAEFLKKTGVNQVSVSLDSTDATQHDKFRGVKGCHRDAVNGLALLTENKINTQVIMTLYKENVSEIEKLADLSSRMGVDSLKINPVMPTGRGKIFFDSNENVKTDELIKLDRWIEEELLSRYSIDIYFDIPIGLKSLHSIKNRRLFECNILTVIGILSDGTISLCGIGETESGLNMGNIVKDDICEVWENNSILQALRREIPRNLDGICGRCIFKFKCRGACRACVYSMTGNLTGPFFTCDEAYRKGLFLESRIIN